VPINKYLLQAVGLYSHWLCGTSSQCTGFHGHASIGSKAFGLWDKAP